MATTNRATERPTGPDPYQCAFCATAHPVQWGQQALNTAEGVFAAAVIGERRGGVPHREKIVNHLGTSTTKFPAQSHLLTRTSQLRNKLGQPACCGLPAERCFGEYNAGSPFTHVFIPRARPTRGGKHANA